MVVILVKIVGIIFILILILIIIIIIIIIINSCLINTARRAVYAQTLLDICSNSSIFKLGEVQYHRPKEVIKNKVYPEQHEVTVLFLCTMIPPNNNMNNDHHDFDMRWKLYCNRSKGISPLPLINLNCFDSQGHPIYEHLIENLHDDDNTNDKPDDTNIAIKTESTDNTDDNVKNDDDEVAFVIDTTPDTNTNTDEDNTNTEETKIDNDNETNGDSNKGMDAIDSFLLDALAAEDTTTTSTTTAASNTTTETNGKTETTSAVVEKVLEKPSTPHLMLCPQPLPHEFKGKQQSTPTKSITLLLLPL